MPPKKKGGAKGGPAAKKAKIEISDSEDSQEEDTPPTQEELKKQTVATLKSTCAQLGLEAKGTKDALIQRILEHREPDGQSVPSRLKQVKRESKSRSKIRKVIEALKNEAQAPKSTTKVDQCYNGSIKARIHEDYACTLNQTNIGQNNNKFYIIQLIEETAGKKTVYHVFTKWGRVGEPGQKSTSAPLTLAKAIPEFEKKFKDKTRNQWDKRANFVPKKGKYTLLEIDDDDSEETVDVKKSTVGNKMEVIGGELTAACTLDKRTGDLMKLLFDKNMFIMALEKMHLDIRKMPLGKLSKVQIAKGFEALVNVEDAIRAKKNYQTLTELSSQFYTLIPHNFGRNAPYVLVTMAEIQRKKDILLVLSDIEQTLALQKRNVTKLRPGEKLKPHPSDVNYKLLNCELSLLDRKSKEFRVIEKYFKATTTSDDYYDLVEIWAVSRKGEKERFSRHNSIKERKLLWHGTNIAVVAAILSNGLRIMPHSGGRVGRGIYFASENNKSADYVEWATDGEGIMFLNEVVLGKEKSITKDDPSLRKAPPGYHSVVARGTQEPDSTFDVTINIEGKKVVVPQGKPVPSQYENSTFDKSEYLIYDESQVRIRYLLMFHFE